MSEPTSEFCAAYACPLIGVYGAGGKWYCCCHRNADASRNDAITLAINSHRDLADKAVLLRRTNGEFFELENQLVELTRDAGTQRSMAAASVIGPTHAPQHYSESEK